jgi:hypothetical protein
MIRHAQIEYRNEPTDPVNITLHIYIDGRHECRHGITSKAEAMQMAALRDAVLV